MKSNCIAWAVAAHVRRRRAGRFGRLYWRKSDWGWFPHMLYGETFSRGGRRRFVMLSFKPVDPRRRALPPPWFVGSVRWGDPPPTDGGRPATVGPSWRRAMKNTVDYITTLLAGVLALAMMIGSFLAVGALADYFGGVRDQAFPWWAPAILTATAACLALYLRTPTGVVDSRGRRVRL